MPRKADTDQPRVPDPVTDYARAVHARQITAGPHVRNAARRHLDDLKRGRERDLWFDVEAANHAIGFFPAVLRLNGGQFEGLPFELDASQCFIIGSLFGWKRTNGTRRFRRAYVEEGKGNGKSPMMAGIGMYMLVADGEARAEVYAAASKKDQAFVLFRDAVAMFQQSPALNRTLTPSGGNPIWNLAHSKSGSWFRPISSDDGQSGPRPSCALLDEIHEHKSSDLLELLERGFKFRRQPLLVMGTNSGSDRKSVCWDEHLHAIRCAAGTKELDDKFTYVGEAFDDDSFGYVASLDPDDDPLEDESCWVKANPLLGTTITYDYLRGVVRQAKAIPGKRNNILRLHFCQWTESDVSWMGRETLEACLADFAVMEHRGKKAFLGLDLSATQDLTALAFVVPTGFKKVKREDGTMADLPTYDAWVEAWTPGDTLTERALRDGAPYPQWVEEGWLEAPEGKVVRFDYLAARVAEAAGLFQIGALAYDSYGFKKHFSPELDTMGVTLNEVEHPQGGKRKGATGLWMPGSKLTLETLLLEGRLRLRRSPVLVSAMMSAGMEGDPFGNQWFSKRKATNRIDALVALAMAVGAATSVEDAAPAYEMYFVG